MDDPWFERMFEFALDSHVMRSLASVRKIADYDVPADAAGVFVRFHSFVSDPIPRYISDWRSDTKTEERWYSPHVNSILNDVRLALAAAHYHASKLLELETAINSLLRSSELGTKMPKQSTMGIGGTRKMDIEYQAFILACRRCLDYLAVGLLAYFKGESNGFRKLPKSLPRKGKPSVVQAITDAHGRHLAKLAFVLGEGKGSVRNRIAHYEAVPAGCFNVTADGVFLAGGGEDLRPSNDGWPTLHSAIQQRLQAIRECVDDVLDSFMDAVRDDSNHI